MSTSEFNNDDAAEDQTFDESPEEETWEPEYPDGNHPARIIETQVELHAEAAPEDLPAEPEGGESNGAHEAEAEEEEEEVTLENPPVSPPEETNINDEVNIHEVGVGGGKQFFESKIEKLTESDKAEESVRKEAEEREKQKKREEFKKKQALFGGGKN